MHELGIVFNIANTLEDYAKQNNIEEIKQVVVEVGQLSTVIPTYLKECYPAAMERSEILKNSELVIEVVPANGRCKECEKIFNVVSFEKKCPHCESSSYELLSGEEFQIKEIMVDNDQQ